MNEDDGYEPINNYDIVRALKKSNPLMKGIFVILMAQTLMLFIFLIMSGVGIYYAKNSDFVVASQNLVLDTLQGANRTVNQDVPREMEQLNDITQRVNKLTYRLDNITNMVSIFVNNDIPEMENTFNNVANNIIKTSTDIDNALPEAITTMQAVEVVADDVHGMIPQVTNTIKDVDNAVNIASHEITYFNNSLLTPELIGAIANTIKIVYKDVQTVNVSLIQQEFIKAVNDLTDIANDINKIEGN